MRLLAIDIGASFIKGAILDVSLMTVEHVQRTPFPPFLPDLDPAFREADVNEIVARVSDHILRLLQHVPNCRGILMCSQMHGMVLANERQEALSNFISWQDQRTLLPHPSGEGTYFDVLFAKLTDDERIELGNEIRPGYPVSTLYWLAQNGKLPHREDGQQIVPASLADFVVARLSGAPVCTEPTLASAHGCYDLRHDRWHAGVIDKLGLAGLDWPTLVRTGDAARQTTIDGKAIPIYTPVGDQQAALAGAFLEEDELSLNIATGSQISRLSSKLEFGHYQVRPFFDGQYLNTITHIPAGRALNALVRLLTEIPQAQGTAPQDPWEIITGAMAVTEETDLNVDLSFFPSTTGFRGGITNISEQNLTVGHLFRAAFQNMADNYEALEHRLSANKNTKWKRLVFAGGIAQKNPLLRELICAKFDSPFRICESAEDTLLGLLCLSLVFTRQAATLSEAARRIRDLHA